MVQKYSSIGHSEGRLTINALRGGTAKEIAEFLNDLDAAYRVTYDYLQRDSHYFDWEFFPAPRRYREAFAMSQIYRSDRSQSETQPLPEYQLVVQRVVINSPGFWEFVGGLNPLQHIRDYLKERHERCKDDAYRNNSEQERMRLENELLKQTLVQKKLENIRRVSEIDPEFPLEDILSNQIWNELGPSYAKLGHHQDTGLIACPKTKNGNEDE